ncbi:MAG: zinc metalloprotease HtpX [candidate division WOR-3 bacterium]
MPQESKVFWDIEKEKTHIIYLLFGVLVFFYFISFFGIWTIFKLLIHFRLSLENPQMKFHLIGNDTLIILTFAFVFALGHWFYTNRKMVEKILKTFNAHPPDKSDRYHYIFQNILEEISIAGGGIKVEPYVLPTIAMNAFALQDIYGRNIIGVTEGSISRLKRDELQAVVAHEMAHIISNDSLLTTVASSLFGIYGEILDGILKNLNQMGKTTEEFFYSKGQRNAIAGALFTAPVFIILLIMNFLSQLLYVFISREKEYRADINAIKYTRNPLSLARALYKIASHYRGPPSYLTPIFIVSPEANPLEDREDIVAHLFSTHPPLQKRLQLILDQAHADISQITEITYKKSGGEESEKPPLVVFAQKDDQWFGPFTLYQLQAQDWLTPDTEVKIGDDGPILKAINVPTLSNFLKIKETPLGKMRRLCPLCKEWLIPQEYEGLYIWLCAFCGGSLVEKEKLPRIIVRKDKTFPDELTRCAKLMYKETRGKKLNPKLYIPALEKRRCPKCGKPMMRKFFSYAYLIEIDECSECNLIWFDKNELEILQCMIEMEENDGKR